MTSPADLLALLAVPVALLPAIFAVRVAAQRQRDGHRHTYRLGFPRTLTHAQVSAFLATLAGLATPRLTLLGRDGAVLEVVSSGGRLSHRLRVPAASSRYYVSQLRAIVPGIEIVETDEALPACSVVQELQRRGPDRPLAIPNPAATAATVLAAASGSGRGVAAVWQVVLVGGSPNRPLRPWSQVLGDAFAIGRSQNTASTSKAMEATVSVSIRVGASGARLSARERVARLRRAAASVSVPGGRLVPYWSVGRLAAARLRRGATPVLPGRVPLTLPELSALIGWPIGAPVIAGLRLGGAPQLPAAIEVPRTGRVLGDTTAEPKRPVAVSVAASVMHGLVLGPTGSGKSWLAASLALGDIAAGRGVCVIDPKGSLIRRIAERIPEDAIDRVLWIDPTDEARPVPLPLLSPDANGSPELAADALIALLRHRYRDLGPRSSDVITSSLLTLARTPGATLLDLLRLWGEPGYRAAAVGRVGKDPALASFWAWFDALGNGERGYVLAPALNKIRPLVQRSAVRNVIASPRATFSFTEALRESRVILVSLPESVLGAEATNLLGQVVLARLWSAVQQPRRRPFFVTVDEAHRFLDQPTDLGDSLAMAREWQTGYTLLTQSTAQLPERLREVASGSARTKVSFQAYARDAARQAAEFGPRVSPDMLTALPEWTAIGQVPTGGSVSEPFTFRTRPLDDAMPGRLKAVRAASRARYGVPREEIEASFVRPDGSTDSGPRDGGFGPVGRRTER